MELEDAYDRVATVVNQSADPTASWVELIRFTVQECGEAASALRSFPLAPEFLDFRAQLDRLIEVAPVPHEVDTLYFGLFDAIDPTDPDRVATGFYVSGASGYVTGDPDTLVDPVYFPEDRFLASALLEAVRGLSYADADHAEFYEYALTLGAAGLLVRHSVLGLPARWKVVVGFDSGDVLDLDRPVGA